MSLIDDGLTTEDNGIKDDPPEALCNSSHAINLSASANQCRPFSIFLFVWFGWVFFFFFNLLCTSLPAFLCSSASKRNDPGCSQLECSETEPVGPAAILSSNPSSNNDMGTT